MRKLHLHIIILFTVFLNFDCISQSKAPQLKVPFGHSDVITSFDTSSDESLIATGSKDNTVIIWDLKTGKELKTFFFKNEVVKLQFTFDSKQLLITEKINFFVSQFSIWDIKSSKIIKKYPFSGNSGSILSPINNLLLVPSFSENFKIDDADKIYEGIVTVYDLNTNQKNKSFKIGMNSDIKSIGTGTEYELKFLPQNKELFAINADSNPNDRLFQLKIWNLNNLEEPIRIIDFQNPIKAISTSKQNETFAVLSLNKISLYKITSEIPIGNFSIEHKIEKISLSEDGSSLLGYGEKKVYLWNLKTNENFLVKDLELNSKIEDVKLSKSGKYYFIITNNKVIVCDNNGTIINELVGQVKKTKKLYFLENQRFLAQKIITKNDKENIKKNGLSDMLNTMGVSLNSIEEDERKEIQKDLDMLPKVLDSLYEAETKKSIQVWDLDKGESYISDQVNDKLQIGKESYLITNKTISSDKKYELSNTYIIDEVDNSQKQLNSLLSMMEDNSEEDDSAKQIRAFLQYTNKKKEPEGKIKIVINKANNDTIKLIALNDNEWFIINSKGYYKCSKNAAKLVSYTTENDEVILFDQLDLKFNRPDIILQSLGSNNESLIDAYYKTYLNRIERHGISLKNITNDNSPPEADFTDRNTIDINRKAQKIELRIKGSSPNSKLLKYNLWVNEVPIYGDTGKLISESIKNNFSSIETIILSNGRNKIEVSVTNKNGIESYRKPLYLYYNPTITKKPTTYFIGIGMNKYSVNEMNNLKYTLNDIRSVTLEFKNKLNKSVIIDTLFNESFTQENIDLLKKKLEKVDINDNVILFYSGHGKIGNDKNYYFPTSIMSPSDYEKLEKTAISYKKVESLLDNIPSRNKLFLIDACYSGVFDINDRLVLDDSKMTSEIMDELFSYVGRGTGTTVITSSSGTEVSHESRKYKHGYFTQSILEAINKYKSIDVDILKKYILNRVPIISSEENQEQTPTVRSENREANFKLLY